MDPGPSIEGERPLPPPGVDFLKNSYIMSIEDPIKVATIKQYLESERDKAVASISGNAAIGVKTRFDMFIIKIGGTFDDLFTGMNAQRVQSYKKVLEDAINLTRGSVADEEATNQSALNTTIASDAGVGGKRKRKTRKNKKSKHPSPRNSASSHRRTRKH